MEIEKPVIQSCLELIQKCSSISINDDVSDKVMFFENGMLNISRSRLVTILSCPIDFEGVFPIDNILKIVRAISGDTISMNFIEDELKITSSKTKLGLKPLAIENWKSKYVTSIFQYMEGKQPDFKPLPPEFISGLKAVYQCIGIDKKASILNNVAVIKNNLIASNNFSIGHYLMTKRFKESFLIDGYNIQSIIEFNPLNYYLDSDRIIFTNEPNTMVCAISPIGKYPDFLPILAKSKEEGLKISFPEDLNEMIFIAQQLPGKNEDSQIQLTIGKNKLALAYNTINGWFKKNLRIDYDQTPFSINMNIDTLSDGLKSIGNDLYISEEGTAMMQLDAFSYVFPIEIIE
jgi:hypothetical protein